MLSLCCFNDVPTALLFMSPIIAVSFAYLKFFFLSCNAMWSGLSREKTTEINVKFLRLTADCHIHYLNLVWICNHIQLFFCPFMSDITPILSFFSHLAHNAIYGFILNLLSVTLIFLWQFYAPWQNGLNKFLDSEAMHKSVLH